MADRVRATEIPTMRAMMSTPTSSESPALRLHAEWSIEGVRLWCGADKAVESTATALAPQLVRSLGEQGVRLITLVCNGRAIYAASAPMESAGHSDTRQAVQDSLPIPRVQFYPQEYV